MRFKVGEKIRFAEESHSPYTVKAMSSRFAILTRPATRKDFKDFGQEKYVKGQVVYTIVDNTTMMRGPHNLIFSPYDFATKEDINACMAGLESGTCELSRRNSIPVVLTEES